MAATVLAMSLTACGGGHKGNPDAGNPPETAVTVDRPITLTDVARIPQNDPNFDHAVATATGVTLYFTKNPTKTYEVGDVIAGSGDTPYLRTITGIVSATDKRLEVTTDSAYITDLIHDGAFTVTISPDASKWVANQPFEVSGRTFYQTKFNVFSLVDKNGFDCTPIAGGPPIKITPELSPDFSPVVKVDIQPSLIPPFGELQSAEFSINGTITAGLTASVTTEAGVQCTFDLVAFLRSTEGDNFLRLQYPIETLIGPVPIEFTLFIDPVFQVEGTVSGKAGMTLAASGTLGAKVGVEYKDGAWSRIWEPTRSGSVSAEFPTDTATITASGKVSAGMKFGALIYDAAGPSFTLTDYVEHKVDVKPLECTYDATASLGIDGTIGLQVQIPVIAKPIAEVSQSFNLAQLPIAHDTGMLPWCVDAGVPDAGIADAGVEDAALTDAALTDAALTDAPLADAAPTDAATIDAISADAGPCTQPTPTPNCSGGWCQIPAGCFTMGSPPSEPCRYAALETQREVTLTHPFEIMQLEVTEQQFFDATGFWINQSGDGTCGTSCPVDGVAWYRAALYANTQSVAAGLTPCYDCTGTGVNTICVEAAAYAGANIYNCPGYRLPTDAEWEYAYRAGSTTAYYDGPNTAGLCNVCNDVDPAMQEPYLNPIAWYCSNNNGYNVYTGGQKQANAWGIYDMAGNAPEWIEDVNTTPDVTAGSVTDPTGVANTNQAGIFFFYRNETNPYPEQLRAAFRNFGSALQSAGIRLVRTR